MIQRSKAIVAGMWGILAFTLGSPLFVVLAWQLKWCGGTWLPERTLCSGFPANYLGSVEGYFSALFYLGAGIPYLLVVAIIWILFVISVLKLFTTK
ncbi:hypothetical protein [Aliiroseovarius sp. F20344]|uniref:hypothetical protein n=1 Tax=Aliiroseovarius sp. F20344 TaxID=2926414 RepID=UPI001FF2E493|nr:hypothetical protein [Aliiroseovarius sp. F20344]MCK0142028.1 hypothetical protein [Aliiroseovarius sp. F20344]